MFGWISWLFPRLPRKGEQPRIPEPPPVQSYYRDGLFKDLLYPSLWLTQFGYQRSSISAQTGGHAAFWGLSGACDISGWGYGALTRRVPTNKIESREVKCLYCGSRFVYNDAVAEYKTKKVLQEIKPLKCPNCAGEIDLSGK